MKLQYKGIVLAALHVALVCTVGAKLLYDRSHRPRIWIKSSTYDPDFPIRGRYMSLNAEVPAEGFSMRTQPLMYEKDKDGKPVMQRYSVPSRGDLVLRGAQLFAVANEQGEYFVDVHETDTGLVAVVQTTSTYFLPEHNAHLPHLQRGDELWMEATIPRKGPPRPLRLGVKKNGVLTPLPAE